MFPLYVVEKFLQASIAKRYGSVGWVLWHINLCRLFNAKFIFKQPDIGKMVRPFANGPGDLGSIPGRVLPKTQ